MNLYHFLNDHGIKVEDASALISRAYPAHDLQLTRHALFPELSGVRLAAGAERLVEGMAEKPADEPVVSPRLQHRRERRKLPQRLQVRVSKTDYRRLQREFRDMGFSTVQDGLQHILQSWLRERTNR